MHVNPQLLTAVKRAVVEVFKDENIVDVLELRAGFEACQEELKATKMQLAQMEQKFEVWHKLATTYGDQLAHAQATIEALRVELTALRVELATLQRGGGDE